MTNWNLKQYWDGLRFSEPPYFVFGHLLWLLVLAVLVIVLIKQRLRPVKSKYSTYKLFGPDLIWPLAIIVCGISILALAGPKMQSSYKLSPSGGIDALVLIDDSYSTKADDLKPSRLEIIKGAVIDLASNGTLKSGDRVTLFIFAGQSRWRLPLSEDLDDFKSKVAEISHPEVFEEEMQLDTNFAGVLEDASKSIDKMDGFTKENRWKFNLAQRKYNRIAIMFSDGNDEGGGKFATELRELAKRKVKFYTVGVGTRTGKEVTVQAYDTNDPGKKEKLNIRSALQMKLLDAIAEWTGGKSFALESEDALPRLRDFLRGAVNDNRSTLPRLVYADEGRDIWWEVLVASLLFVIFIIKKA